MKTTMEDAVREAMELAPGSIRAVARKAGVSARLVRMVRDGERTASPAVVERLAAALESFAAEYAQAAARLRQALDRR